MAAARPDPEPGGKESCFRTMRFWLFAVSLLLLKSCAPGERGAEGDRDAEAPAAAPPLAPRDPALGRMLAAIAPFQAEGQPCIAREKLGPDFSPEQKRRSKVIWSDSLELQRRIRGAHGSRILNMAPDVTAGAERARFLVKVTGHDPLPAYRLGGRARDVPVVVEYGMPWSADELQRKVTAATPELMRLLPDAQGWGVSNGYGLGALFVHVYSPSGRPPADLASLCERVIAAAGMPVLLTYGTGRVSVGPG